MALTFNNGHETFREPEGKTFSLVMTGDCCPWGKALEEIREGRAEPIIAATKPFLAGTDVKIMQWETPLADTESPIIKSGANILCPPESTAIMRALDIDVALLANNHTGDHGGATVLKTLDHLKKAGFKTVGAGANLAEASQPLNLTPNGLRLAVLNIAEHEFGTAKVDAPGVAPFNPLATIGAIRKAVAQGELVIVIAHGGHERNPLPSPRMIETFRAFAEAGAHAVINCHTHCPQGIELWQGVPIIHSPGNFFFPWTDLSANHLTALWWIGYVPKLHFDARGVYALEIKPFRFDNDRMYTLPAVDEKAFFDYLAELNRLKEDSKTLQRMFEAWCAKSGLFYLEMLRDRLAAWPIELDSEEALQEFIVVRNLFTCESHHDMLRQTLRLIEEKRLEPAIKDWSLIEPLQQPEWAQKYWRTLLAKG